MSTNSPGRGILETVDDTVELVIRAIAGDVEAFCHLAEERWGDLVAVSRSILADGDAEDVVQESLMMAWQRLHRLREPAAFSAWLKRIVVRRALGRARRRRPLVPLEEWNGVCDHEGGLNAALDVGRLLAALSPRQRAVAHLSWLDGLTDREIGALLGMAPVSVRVHRLRARRRLAALLEGGGR